MRATRVRTTVFTAAVLLLAWLPSPYIGLHAIRSAHKFKEALSSLDDIPKVVHITFPLINGRHNGSGELMKLERAPSIIAQGIREFARRNPSWRVKQSDNKDVDTYLRRKLSSSAYMMMREVHPVHKGDLWRLLKLYHEGGVYTDVDRLHNTDMATLITPGVTKMLLPIYGTLGTASFDFAQDFLATAPRNPLYLEAIKVMLERRAICIRSSGASSAPKDYPSSSGATTCSEYEIACASLFNAGTNIIMGTALPKDPGLGGRLAVLQALWILGRRVGSYLELPPLNLIDFRLSARAQLLTRLVVPPNLERYKLLFSTDDWAAVAAALRAHDSKAELYRSASIPHWASADGALHPSITMRVGVRSAAAHWRDADRTQRTSHGRKVTR